MFLMAIDTSLKGTGIAIVKENELVAETYINNKASSSKILISLINKSLLHLNLDIKEVDAWAVAIGPGNFTGIRIGLMTAKIFSFLSKKPILGISTLEALAYNYLNLDIIEYVTPILPGPKNTIYGATYSLKENRLPEEIVSEGNYELTSFLNKIPKDSIIVGPEVNKYNLLKKKSCLVFKHTLKPDSIARLAKKRIELGKYDDPFLLKARYLRLTDAELNRV